MMFRILFDFFRKKKTVLRDLDKGIVEG